jgi:hypothetical protein
MDQINPLDQRRGMSDVQFENTILPLWMVRADYELPVQSSWLQALQIQGIFNPNLEFRGNEHIVPGNDKFGIWAANINPAPGVYVGSFAEHPDKPGDTFESRGMEFGLRIRAIVYDAIITLNGFYGRDNDWARRLAGPPTFDADGTGATLVHMPIDSYYPIQKFLGATFARDITALRASCLGGVAPVIRMEGVYMFDATNVTSFNDVQVGVPSRFEKSNEIRWMIGADWKVKISLLNPKHFITISPQFYHRHIVSEPHGYKLQDLNGEFEDNNYITSLMVTTNYKNNTIIPFAFWMRDITNKGDFFIFKLTYAPTEVWKYTVGALFIQSDASNIYVGNGFKPLEHKDQLFFTVMYQF